MTVSIVSRELMANHICARNLRSLAVRELETSFKCSPRDCADRIAKPFKFQALFAIPSVEASLNRDQNLPVDLISGQKVHAT